ncbi:MAG: hypothetical protein AAGJ81_01455 [Verrucomicrobiota bacterium]
MNLEWEMIAALSALGGVIIAAFVAVNKIPKSEPRRFPSIEATFATRASLQSLEKKTDERFSAMAAAAASGREKVYMRLGGIEQKLSEQGNEDRNLNLRLSRMETKIDQIANTVSKNEGRFDS